MKRKYILILIGCLSTISLLTSMTLAAPAAEKITVLNPCGQPPHRLVKPMAPRLDTLAGKRIYVTSINFPYTNDFVEILAMALQEKYPEAEWIFVLKTGTYFMSDKKLWQEIKKNGDAMVLAVGH